MTTDGGALALEGWQLVRRMLDDLTETIRSDAENELELLEGLRVLARTTALASELSLDVDVHAPWFFSMNTEVRFLGGPAPDGEYFLAMIDGRHRYRVRGHRGTTAYLGFQVLAGIGLTPRRMSAYVSDNELRLAKDGSFTLVFAGEKPSPEELAGGLWVAIPEDASSVLVREYIADRDTEAAAELTIEPLDPPALPAPPNDAELAEQLTSMAWTIAKLATLYRTIKPELIGMPNQLVTAEAAELGAADTTPDNLYMIGTFRLDPDEALVIELEPPKTRYWSMTLENIWHECIDPRRRHSSLTNAAAVVGENGTVRFVIAADDPGVDNWLDTGGRHRGFVILRWLDNPDPPAVSLEVLPLTDVAG
ncbi:MAG: DUF1214 domain-containing protein [Acidimicrobiales bacterium]